MKFRSDPSLIKGSIAPLITPFHSDSSLDLESLRSMVEWQLTQGSHGVSIGGSTGEPGAQTVQERIDAIEAVAQVVDDRVPFLPGTGSAKLDETLRLTDAARGAGADAALVITPYYARPTQEALIQWYKTIADQVPDMPIVIYNVPSRTAVEIEPDTVLAIRKACANVVGIKDTTKDFEHFSRVISLCGGDFLVWSGIELLCLPLIPLGGVGFVSAVANIAPRAVADMYEAAVSDRWDEARDIHYGLHPLVDSLFVETNPAPAKYALALGGVISDAHVRPPLVSPGEQSKDRIRELLAQGSQFLAEPIRAAL